MLCPGQRSLAGSEVHALFSLHSLEVGKEIKAILVLPLSLLEIATTQGQL